MANVGARKVCATLCRSVLHIRLHLLLVLLEHWFESQQPFPTL